jgi:3-methylcrotonyl-CoA carboxylase alpha subunit
MEMNTRLQVEHPVTEAITGLDLVELQLRVAAGEPLPFKQGDLAINGHSFEARLYAEDVHKGFLPATGTLEHLEMPGENEFLPGAVRVDSGVRQGDAITPYYDPMIAKLVVHGPDRKSALNRLSAALADCRIAGSVTNLGFLGALARHEGFAEGKVDTGLIPRDLEKLAEMPAISPEAIAIAALAGLGMLSPGQKGDPWTSLAGWRHWSDSRQYALLETDGKRFERGVVVRGHGAYSVEDGEDALELKIEGDLQEGLRIGAKGHVRKAHVARFDHCVTVFIDGATYTFTLPDLLADESEGDAAGDSIVAPMPGQVKLVNPGVGEQVSSGDALIVLEAMKMEHTLTAPRDGTVFEILCSEGDQVTDGTVLLVLEAESPAA